MTNTDISGAVLLRTVGAAIAIFSFAVGVIWLFLPTACSFVGGLQLIFSVLFVLMGVVLFLVGQWLVRRRRSFVSSSRI